MTLSAISRRGEIELLAPPAETPLGPGGGEAGQGALADHSALKLRERGHHLHHHSASRGGGVDVLGDRAEAGAGLGDALHDMQHVLQRARQTIELPDHHGVTLPQVVHAVQLGPIPAPARGRLLEQAPTAGARSARACRARWSARRPGDTGIAEQQASAGGFAAFHKRTFAYGRRGHGSSSVTFQSRLQQRRIKVGFICRSLDLI